MRLSRYSFACVDATLRPSLSIASSFVCTSLSSMLSSRMYLRICGSSETALNISSSLSSPNARISITNSIFRPTAGKETSSMPFLLISTRVGTRNPCLRENTLETAFLIPYFSSKFTNILFGARSSSVIITCSEPFRMK